MQQATNSIAAPARRSFRFTKAQTFALVFLSSLFGAAAQILIKTGAGKLTGAGVVAMLLNFHIVTGYSLYGICTLLLILALRDGELSVLYPVISLNFVWVAILSTLYFQEVLTPAKILGIVIIVSGVALLGIGGKK